MTKQLSESNHNEQNSYFSDKHSENLHAEDDNDSIIICYNCSSANCRYLESYQGMEIDETSLYYCSTCRGIYNIHDN